MDIALGKRDPDTVTSLAGRLARLDRQIDEKDKKEIEDAAGLPLKEIINNLLDAVDPDKKVEKAQDMFNTETPTEDEVEKAFEALVKTACEPFDNPEFRDTLITIKKKSEQIIDTISKDFVILAGFDELAKEKARTIVDTFRQFIEDNKDELTALQLIYSKPYSVRHVTFQEIKQLAEAIEKPPYNLTPVLLWEAYENLEKSKVRKAGPQRLLTDIISLIRFAVGESAVLEPFSEIVDERFEEWLTEQEKVGRGFTLEQMEWLIMIKEHIAASLSIEIEDFEYPPFYEKGGAVRAYEVFGEEFNSVLEELNEVLVV
jgi:type I restriction enzyme R subunit